MSVLPRHSILRPVTHTILRACERALLCLGVLALGIYAAAHLDRAVWSRAALREADLRTWSPARAAAYREALSLPAEPLAVLGIPKVEMEVPVFEGTDELTLNRGAGLIPGTARPGDDGNVALAGHRDGFFRALKDVAVGDVLELRTQGETRRYVVDRVGVVEPDDVGVLQDRGRPTVTLVTCYPFYFMGHAPQRWVVQASLSPARENEGRPS